MQIRIDHSKNCIYFGADLSESQREDKLEGVIIQSMPSEQIRNQLVNMNVVLTKCLQTINPNYNRAGRDKLHAAMVKHYHESKHIEHQRILARHYIIEERKEYLEQMNTVREQEEAKKQEEVLRLQAMAEQKRLEIEREERERKRQEKEIQQIRDRTLKEKMHQISLTAHGQKLLKTLQEDELKNLDADKIAAREAEELQKERREQQQRLKMVEKKLDYFERAKRLEEIPLLKTAWKEKQEVDRKFWQQQEVDKIQTMKQERKLALTHRERLKRMEADRNVYLNKLKSQRYSSYKEKLEQFDKELEKIRKERLEQRKKERVEKRKAEYMKQLEEEAERKRQEERRKQEEEERKHREEELEKERKERAEKDRIAEIARKKEEEVERKHAAAGVDKSKAWRSDDKKAPAPATDGGSTWRRNALKDKPSTISAASEDRPPRRDIDDRPRRDIDDRPRRDIDDRPRRDIDDRPRRDMDDRQPRRDEDRPARGEDRPIRRDVNFDRSKMAVNPRDAPRSDKPERERFIGSGSSVFDKPRRKRDDEPESTDAKSWRGTKSSTTSSNTSSSWRRG